MNLESFVTHDLATVREYNVLPSKNMTSNTLYEIDLYSNKDFADHWNNILNVSPQMVLN